MSDDATDDQLPAFDPDSGAPAYLYDRLADHLAGLITQGHFRLYEQFPGEVKLSQVFGVALGTARHAIERLRERGLVATVRSKGTYVTYDAEATCGEQADHHGDRGPHDEAQPGTPDVADDRS
ncbi:DNA-binding GntR family transcriptional regulator [Amycolatopsis bartoniae]|nr:winged helix-turn-helix domain-containing protein [Amycolatopsis bartoniae]MBB2935073.1 DNA-binding GntR family transcriptional regulator [Amycolatopsis bartoniae]TVT02572.1 winged helix-turn-helix transcriptional regulator [Amycolatopsis bartoniae]